MNEVMLQFKPSKKLEANDVLVFKGDIWTNVSKNEYLAELHNEIRNLQEKLLELDDLKQKVAELRGED